MSDAIDKLSPTHEQMILWIMQNPGGTLREMGAYFDYSIPWLCQVVNSDMFKAALGVKMGKVEAIVVADIPTKLRATAALAIDRMNEVLEKSTDQDTIVDAFDKVLHRYGYAPNAKTGAQAGIVQQNNFYLSKDEFQDAKKALIDAHSQRPALPSPDPQGVEDAQLVPSS